MPVKLKGTDLIYFSIPKTACTSLKQAVLGWNEPEFAQVFPAHDETGRLLPREFRGRQYFHVHEFYPSIYFRPRWYVSPGMRGRWFCVLRDPLERLLSAYGNRVIHHRDLEQDPAAVEAAGLSLHPDVDEFVMKLEAYTRVNRRIYDHVRPVHHYLGPVARRFDRIFTLRQLSDLAAYCADAGAPLEVPYLQTGGPKIPLSDLSQKAQTKLRRYYALDYLLYGRYLR